MTVPRHDDDRLREIAGGIENLRSRGTEPEDRLSILIEPLGHILEVAPCLGLVCLRGIGRQHEEQMQGHIQAPGKLTRKGKDMLRQFGAIQWHHH